MNARVAERLGGCEVVVEVEAARSREEVEVVDLGLRGAGIVGSGRWMGDGDGGCGAAEWRNRGWGDNDRVASGDHGGAGSRGDGVERSGSVRWDDDGDGDDGGAWIGMCANDDGGGRVAWRGRQRRVDDEGGSR